MSNIVTLDQMEWLQEGMYLAALATSFFDRLNCVFERKFRADKEVELSAIWMTPRNGSAGCGALFEMPKIITPLPNSQVNTLRCGAVVFEERNINISNAGTGKTAEQWANVLGEFYRGWIIGQSGGLVPSPDFISPAEDWIRQEDGIIALRVSVEQRVSRKIFNRCITPAFQLNNYLMSFQNNALNPDATIYYTVDGSFPGEPVSSQTLSGFSETYVEPFQVEAGQIVNWMAVQEDYFPSNVGTQLIT